MTDDDPFRRLLRWYPASWRRAHGDIVAGMLRDVAEATGGAAPSPAERRSARIEGLAHHLDRRLALVAAVAAVVLAAAGFILYLVVPAILQSTAGVLPWEGGPTAMSVVAAVTIFSVPLFVAMSLIATLRVRGLRAGPALASLVIATLATVLLAGAGASWSIGFDEADAGVARSPFAAAWLFLAAGAALLGATATAILIGTMLAGRLRGWAYVIGGAAGLVLAPTLMITLPSPATAGLAAIGALVLADLGTRPPRRDTRSPAGSVPSAPGWAPASAAAADSPGPHGRAAEARSRWIAGLATTSFVLGIPAVAFAFAGSQWSALDATEAMRAGIASGALAAIPFALCVGVARTGHRTRDRWGPAALLAAAAAALAIVNAASDGDGNAIVWQLLLCALPIAGAVAWLLLTSWGAGDSGGILAIGAALPVLVLALGLQLLPFLTPVAALVVAVSASVRRRRRAVAVG
ncbi:hypothetical protein [Microbacterium sp. CH-015]|uniref:hypothetical protein n=1 Tax=Microbacterium sp. CH-015 TaxID=3406734 RepID=UPI003C76B3E3